MQKKYYFCTLIGRMCVTSIAVSGAPVYKFDHRQDGKTYNILGVQVK